MMLSVLMTLLFYGAGCVVVMGRCPNLSARLLGIGALPVAWISLCGLAGLLDTLMGLPPVLLLMTVEAFVALLAISRLPRRAKWVDAKAFVVIAWPYWCFGLCAIGVAFQVHQLEPWGGWDSLFTWVLRARFFFAGGGEWKNAFSNDLALLHPDYPPLLGWALHALWRIDGHATTSATLTLFSPVWLGYVLLVCGFQAISTERFRLTFSTAVVLATPILWKLAALKLADFALTYSILGCCAFYTYAATKQDRGAACLSGFLAGWCCLIKNEGLTWFGAFFTVSVAVCLLSRLEFNRRVWIRIMLGAAIPAVAVGLFKLTLAPPSDLVDPTRSFEIGELVQPGILIHPSALLVRLDQIELPIYHRLIWDRIGQVFLDWRDWGATLWWGALLLAFRLRRPASVSPLLVAIAMQLVVYYLVYLITPYHPYWHLSTSLSRILAHVVPAGLCLLSYDLCAIPILNSKPHGFVRRQSSREHWDRYAATAYLTTASLGSVLLLQTGYWRLGEQPVLKLGELAEIGFPTTKVASYVSSDLGIRDLYATQSAAVPTVLVVDRREPILLARFPDETALRQYCNDNHWTLESNQGGFGWARDNGGTELPQPVKVPRIQ